MVWGTITFFETFLLVLIVCTQDSDVYINPMETIMFPLRLKRSRIISFTNTIALEFTQAKIQRHDLKRVTCVYYLLLPSFLTLNS